MRYVRGMAQKPPPSIAHALQARMRARIDGLSDEQLAALSAACESEQARRVEASRRAGADGPSAEERRQLEVMTRQVSSGAASSALGAIGVEGKAAVAAEQGCATSQWKLGFDYLMRGLCGAIYI